MPEIERPRATSAQPYACDITYGTNNEFGFDYLRDNMAMSRERQVQRGHAYAIVDEVDSILIDEARTPLIISGRVADAAELYYQFASIVRGLERDVDYDVDEEKRTVAPTEEGIEKVERALGVENLYDEVSANLVHQLQAALRAKELYKRDKDYVVQHGEVKIVDEFTGRILEGRRWSEGLHQAVEAKEGVQIKEENQTLATITLQNYFRLYEKLAGMTGTAETEAAEFAHTYDLQVVPDPDPPADGPRRPGRPHLQDRGRQVRRRRRRPRRALRDGPAGARRHGLGREVRAPRRGCSRSGASPHEVLNAKQHDAGGRDRRPGRAPPLGHRGHQHGRPRRRHPPRRQPRGPGRAARSLAEGLDPDSTEGEAALRGAARASTRPSARPRATRSASSAASTCSAPSATRAAASTTSSGAAPAARATRARAASTCRSRTSSCACSPPAP